MTNLRKYDLSYHILKDVLSHDDIVLLDNASTQVETGIMSDDDFGKLLFNIAKI